MGGAIFNLDGTVTLTACTLAGNVIDADSGSDVTAMDPLLGPPTDNGGPTDTLLPMPGSPAINGGGNCALSTDQRGETLVIDAVSTLRTATVLIATCVAR